MTIDKYLEIIPEESVNLIKELVKKTQRFETGMTPIQIENFVLNDVEFPTPYGKHLQSEMEMNLRVGTLVNLYYDIKEKEIESCKKERALTTETDPLEKELLELQKEKIEVQIEVLKKEVKKVIKEITVFYNVFSEHPEFENLSKEDAFKLEFENWRKKCLNMPLVFEERYGDEFMKKILGDIDYRKFKELRRKGWGMLPREIFITKQLEG